LLFLASANIGLNLNVANKKSKNNILFYLPTIAL
jgi:hypothetical protein